MLISFLSKQRGSRSGALISRHPELHIINFVDWCWGAGGNYSSSNRYSNISTGVPVDFHMIHYTPRYTQIIWEEVESNWKAVAISIAPTVNNFSYANGSC